MHTITEGTPGCIQAFSLYSTLSKHCTPIVMDWDPKKQMLVTNGPQNSKYYLWYFNMFVVVFAIGFSSCIYTATSYDTLPIHLVANGGMFAAFSVTAWACSFIDILDPYSLVNGINNLSSLRQLIDIQFGNVVTQPNLKFEAYWTWISRSLIAAVGVFAGISCAMPIVFIAMPFPLDPFFVTIPLVFPASATCLSRFICEIVYNGVIWLFRFVISIISTTTCCRYYAMYFTLWGYTLELQSRCLETFNRVPFGIKMDLKVFKWYRSLQFVHEIYKLSMSWVILICLGDGFIICVVCNVVTLKRYNIPIEVYWIAPAVSVLCCVFMGLLLHIVLQIDVRSRELIRKRVAYSSYSKNMSIEWKLVRKQFKFMRPVTLKCGPFMPLGSGIDTLVLEGICIRTIDVVLLQP